MDSRRSEPRLSSGYLLRGSSRFINRVVLNRCRLPAGRVFLEALILREFGVCLVKLKRPREAAVEFRKLTVLRPDDRRARYALAVSLMDATLYRDAIAALKSDDFADHLVLARAQRIRQRMERLERHRARTAPRAHR